MVPHTVVVIVIVVVFVIDIVVVDPKSVTSEFSQNRVFIAENCCWEII